MRYDIFTKPQDWKLYVQAVTKANTVNIIRALEAGGEHVGAFYHARVMGRMVYQTGEGWDFSKRA